MAGRRRQYGLCDRLAEKDSAAQIDRQDVIEVLGLQVEQVAAHDRADAGIVDQAIEAAEFLQRRFDKRLVGGDVGNIAGVVGESAILLRDGLFQAIGRYFGQIGDHDVEAVPCQSFGAGAADAARAAGDEGEGTGHAFNSVLRM